MDGSTEFLGAADPNQLAQALNVDITSGQEQFPSDGILVDARVAENDDLQVGSTVTLEFQNDKPIKNTVAGLFLANSMPAQYITSLDTFEKGG